MMFFNLCQSFLIIDGQLRFEIEQLCGITKPLGMPQFESVSSYYETAGPREGKETIVLQKKKN